MGKGEATLITLAKFTRIVIIVYIVTAIANLLTTTATFLHLENTVMLSSDNDDAITGFLIFSILSAVLGLINLVSIPVSIVLVAVWVYRAWANLHEAQITGLNYTPGWATASFFIPFVNMIVPMRALRELHNRSHGESDWHAAISVGDVSSWYACTWAAFLVGMALTVFLALDSIPNLYVLLPDLGWILLVILLTIFVLGSAYFLFRIIGKVTAAQSAMLHYAQADVFE